MNFIQNADNSTNLIKILVGLKGPSSRANFCANCENDVGNFGEFRKGPSKAVLDACSGVAYLSTFSRRSELYNFESV